MTILSMRGVAETAELATSGFKREEDEATTYASRMVHVAPTMAAPSDQDEHDMVSLLTIWRGLRVVLMISLAGAGGAAIAVAAVLGPRLSFSTAALGFCIAFLMIMFIGLPLMLASINDALQETH